MKNPLVGEPYRLLFVLGFISCIEGASLWGLLETRSISFYPNQAHAQLMIFGFLMAFISGFLMTAVPRMLGTKHASPAETGAAAVLIAAQWIVNAVNLNAVSVAIFVLQVLVLIFFFARRLSRRGQVPEGFLFMPFAFYSALAGPVVYLLATMNLLNISDPVRWLFLWSGQAFVLNLICGLGSRLIPVLVRLPQALPMSEKTPRPNYKKAGTLAALLNFTFVIEAFGSVRLGLLLRALWVLWFAVSSLGILKTATTRSVLGVGLKSGVVFIFLGYALASLFPERELHFLHLVFIGGFALMTFMVATRVVIAHGGKSTDIELSSPAITAIVILFLVSGFARALWLPEEWHQGLWLTASAFLFSSSLWMLFFGRYTYES